MRTPGSLCLNLTFFHLSFLHFCFLISTSGNEPHSVLSLVALRTLKKTVCEGVLLTIKSIRLFSNLLVLLTSEGHMCNQLFSKSFLKSKLCVLVRIHNDGCCNKQPSNSSGLKQICLFLTFVLVHADHWFYVTSSKL